MKKPLRLTETNREAIRLALAEVNGRAEAHTFTEMDQLERIAEKMEERLAALKFTAKERAGARCVAVSGSEVSKAYARKGHTRIATRVGLERRPSGWFLTAAATHSVYEAGGYQLLQLHPDQKALAVFRFAQNLCAYT